MTYKVATADMRRELCHNLRGQKDRFKIKTQMFLISREMSSLLQCGARKHSASGESSAGFNVDKGQKADSTLVKGK